MIPTLNVRAALDAVATQNAQAGFVYKTDVTLRKNVRIAWNVSRDKGPAIVYPLAILRGRDNPATQKAYRFLISPEARTLYQKYGFIPLSLERS